MIPACSSTPPERCHHNRFLRRRGGTLAGHGYASVIKLITIAEIESYYGMPTLLATAGNDKVKEFPQRQKAGSVVP